jgi:glutamate N-acetyltransferase/amino-acid N-acetyltransferase
MEEGSKHVTGGITAPAGFRASGVACGIKKGGNKDLAVVISEDMASVAGVFTTNKVFAAPVSVSREHIKKGTAKAIVINSGNANACNGQEGLDNAVEMCKATGAELGVSGYDVLVASTGIIGVPMPMDNILMGISKAAKKADAVSGKGAAEAIMTTDTYAKEAAVEFDLNGRKVRIGGMAKGAGMINPEMATMIAVITTDARVEPVMLRDLLKEAVETTFNCITVDGDMSTNDTVFIMANGASGVKIGETGKTKRMFAEALKHLTNDLAEEMVKDGEGASKFIQIIVDGARDHKEAKSVGLKVANSLLVKCALFGEDANWGRILAAVGSSGADVDQRNIDVYIADEAVFKKGSGTAFCRDKVEELMKGKEIDIRVELNKGKGKARILTTDLTYEYVKINAHYRT